MPRKKRLDRKIERKGRKERKVRKVRKGNSRRDETIWEDKKRSRAGVGRGGGGINS